MKIPTDNPDAENADFRELSKYLSWVAGDNRVELQFSDYDLGIAFAGAAVMSIGYVMRQAVAIKSESDQII